MHPSAREPAPSESTLRQELEIETPEHVAVHLELAGAGSRTAAALVDTVLATLVVILVVVGPLVVTGLIRASEGLSGWVEALAILLGAFAFLAYFILFEALNGGRTPGKQLLGIRVVLDTGHALTPSAAFARNVFRLLDCYFPLLPFVPGLGMMFLHPRNQRLGDLVAGTVVVRDRPLEGGLARVAPRRPDPIDLGPPALSDGEFRLLDGLLTRAADLTPAVQNRIAGELARRFQDRIPGRTAEPHSYLVALHADEVARRHSRFATGTRGGFPGRTTVAAERFAARKREAWADFHATAIRLERTGIRALRSEEIPLFAARYREVAADLARARTYGVDPRVVEHLERVVSAGHNALYRARGRRRTPVGRYLLRDFPAAVVQSRRYVALAALLLVVPALLGYAMIRDRPALGEELMPMMVSRAEQAADNEARGIGYAQSSERDLPVIASAIVSNNVFVALWVFVGGLLAGTLTVWLLVQNGLMLGMGFGLFANYHAVPYLATFVAGHGVLELTAICVAAGAGLRLAGALIAPGDRTRRDALVLEGRIAARMIGAVVTLLAIAGTIEGLLSASDAPPPYKYATSAASVLLLGLYFHNGRAGRRANPSAAEGALSEEGGRRGPAEPGSPRGVPAS